MSIMILLLTAGIVYGVVAWFMIRTLDRIKRSYTSVEKPVSVVIAARNERQNIGACLAALAAQDYPPELMEVIVVDDRSDDYTSAVVERFDSLVNNLACITIDHVPSGISPKKNALVHAITRAHGEIIIQTDADCIPPSSWISGMVSGFEHNVGMVTGIAPYYTEPGILNSFVRHEYLWNAALSSASIALGHGTHASGRNIAFKKDIFESIGGYGSGAKVLSGDDTLLLHRFHTVDSASIVSMPLKSSHVFTHAPHTFRSFIRQRVRHMSTGKFFDPVLITLGFFIYGFHILMVSTLLLSFFSAAFLPVFMISFIWKCFIDAMVAVSTKKNLYLSVTWSMFVINELFLLFYMAFMPLLGVIVPIKWKEKG